MYKTRMAFLAIAVIGSLGPGSAAIAQREPMTSLAGLASGRWDLRLRASSAPPEQLCIHSGRQLIQLRHRQQTCEQFVVSDEANDVTVQYTCRGKGYGRTHVHRENDRLVQIETQGIAEGLPFNFTAEGRWVSATCTG